MLPRQGPGTQGSVGHKDGTRCVLQAQHSQSSLAAPSPGTSSQGPAAPKLRAKGSEGGGLDSQKSASPMLPMAAGPYGHPSDMSSLVNVVTPSHGKCISRGHPHARGRLAFRGTKCQ